MAHRDAFYLDKAQEALAGAQSEFINGRYNNSANRSYYACFQAAIQALADAGVPARTGRTWSHEGVQATFARELVTRRKLYSGDLRSVLLRNQELRLTADYEQHVVTQTQASRAVRRAEAFVLAVAQGGDTR